MYLNNQEAVLQFYSGIWLIGICLNYMMRVHSIFKDSMYIKWMIQAWPINEHNLVHERSNSISKNRFCMPIEIDDFIYDLVQIHSENNGARCKSLFLLRKWILYIYPNWLLIWFTNSTFLIDCTLIGYLYIRLPHGLDIDCFLITFLQFNDIWKILFLFRNQHF